MGAPPGNREAPRRASRERHTGQEARGEGEGAPRDAPPGEGRGEGPGEETGGRSLEKGEAPAPLLQKSPHIPARGDRLAVTASRPGARTPSRPSPCHCRHISPSTPAPACAWLGPRASVIPADSARSAPHTVFRRFKASCASHGWEAVSDHMWPDKPVRQAREPSEEFVGKMIKNLENRMD